MREGELLFHFFARVGVLRGRVATALLFFARLGLEQDESSVACFLPLHVHTFGNDGDGGATVWEGEWGEGVSPDLPLQSPPHP